MRIKYHFYIKGFGLSFALKWRLRATLKWPFLNVGRVWRNIVPSLALFEQKIVLNGVVHLASNQRAKKVVSDSQRLVDFCYRASEFCF